MRFNFKLVLSLAVAIPSTLAKINGKCYSGNGVCITTSACKKSGGSTLSGLCPNDPSNVKCCIKSCKYNNKAGKCMFKSQCKGTSHSGLCPGGSDFQCCIPKDTTKKSSSKKSSSKKSTIYTSSYVKKLVTSLLAFEEGTSKKGVCVPYADSLHYPTIGYGRLCKKVKVKNDRAAKPYCSSLAKKCTKSVAKQWLSEDIDSKIKCIASYSRIRDAYNKASDKRKAIIISMAYQLGCGTLDTFKTTLSLMAKGKWADASVNMLKSKWASEQTPSRAKRHAYVIKNNKCSSSFCKNYGW